MIEAVIGLALLTLIPRERLDEQGQRGGIFGAQGVDRRVS